jgi:hypothetical protein
MVFLLAASPAQYETVEKYTTVRFSNAPESIWRIVAVNKADLKRLELSLRPGVCFQPPMKTIRKVIVVGANTRDLAPGTYVMTGVLDIKGTSTLVIRQLNMRELAEYSCRVQ